MARRKRSQKKADETIVDIVEVRDSAQDFIDNNQKLILGVVLALVVVIGGYIFYKNIILQPKQQEAMEQMSQAQFQFERDSFIVALTNPGGGYSGFLDIIENYKGTKAANLALYYAGISYLNLGQYEAAIDYLKDYNPSGSVTPVMRFGALGDAYSEQQDYDKALSFYKKAANAGDNELLAPYYLKKVGMMHERNGNFAEAKATYEIIKKDFPLSTYSSDIDKYISRVADK